MKTAIRLLTLILAPAMVLAQDVNSEHARKTLEIYERIIEVETSKGLGNVPEVANYLG